VSAIIAPKASTGFWTPAKQLFASQGGQWVEIPLRQDYVRPSEWIKNTITPGEQKIQMIALLTPTSVYTRSVAVQCQGDYTVTWGDGTASENFTSGVTAKHTYTLANLGSPVASGDYQAQITIVPQGAGTLTVLDLVQPFEAGKLSRNPIAEIITGPNTITTFKPTSVNTIDNPFCQRIELLSPITTTDSTTCPFWQMTALREIIGTINYTGTTLAACFTNCFLLQKTPIINLTSACTQLTTTFQSCQFLQDPPVINGSSGVLSVSSCLNSCTSLRSVPTWDLSACNTFTNFMVSCRFIRDGGAWTFTQPNTNASGMFTSLPIEVVGPFTGTANVITWTSMFANCYQLRRILGTLNMSAATSAVTPFLGDIALESVDINPGPNQNITIVGNFDATQLNAIYNNLPPASAKTITVTGVPGGAGDDPTIATAKGWTVTGS